MNTSPFVILTSLAALASAAAAGMMYVFSTFVMRGLDRTAPVEAITAMRGMNVSRRTPTPRSCWPTSARRFWPSPSVSSQ